MRTPSGVGIYHSNLRGHIYNNLSVHNGTVGIQLWHAANAVIVANNTVVANDENGVVIGAGDSPGGITNDNSLVINNIAVNNAFYGIQEFGKTGSGNRYLNDLVFENPAGNLVLLTGTASGTITAAANFVNNTKNATGDYHLSPKSPAIDAGITANAPTTDIVEALGRRERRSMSALMRPVLRPQSGLGSKFVWRKSALGG